MLDFRNINALWSSVLVETFYRLGLTTAVISPGSRSTALTVAFAQHSKIEIIPILDERSAAFFALGIAKRVGLPVVLVCTSGTAGANFYPAIIEASSSNIPLIVITADRPWELRFCNAGQTIDQVKFYGSYPNWYSELALPEANINMLKYLRQNIIQAWCKSLYPFKGVVHLNLPFRKPLAPIEDEDLDVLKSQIIEKDFFNFIGFNNSVIVSQNNFDLKELEKYRSGIIIAGLAQPNNPEKYCQGISFLAKKFGFPLLADALSPLRNYAVLNPNLISTYDLILRKPKIAQSLVPEVIIQIGELPTSNILRNWLKNIDRPKYIFDRRDNNYDPLHSKTIHIRQSIEQIGDLIKINSIFNKSDCWKKWQDLEIKTRQYIDFQLDSLENLYEGKVSWLLSEVLPDRTPFFIANSMSVRNAEFFWRLNNKKIITYFNRGANGIDGTLSTALGIAYNNQSSVLLTGDLALLHDTNGFLIGDRLNGHLTIILINNNGGGIFEMLPISQFDPPFEEYFATPQNIDFSKIAATYNIEHIAIDNWQQLRELLNPLPTKGIRLLEVKCDRKLDINWLQKFYFNKL